MGNSASVTNNGENALHRASRQGAAQIVQQILNQNTCDVNSLNNNGDTALHLASDYGHDKIVEILLTNSNCDVNLINKEKDSALHVASRRGHVRIAQLLFNNSHCDVKQLDSDGNSAFHLMTIFNRYQIVKQFIKKPECDVNFLNKDKNSALHLASSRGYEKIVKHLLKSRQCDVNLLNNNGQSALHLAVIHRRYKIVELLMRKHGCDVNVRDSCGNSALYVALSCGYEEVAQQLLSNTECKVNIQNEDKNSALHLASLHGLNLNVKELLANSECDFNLRNKNQNTALHLANRYEIIEQLAMDDRCDLTLIDSNGNTGLMTVVIPSANWDIAQKERTGSLLIERIKCICPRISRTIVNHQNNKGDTLIHLACKYAMYDLLDFLLSKNECNISIKNNRGHTFLNALIENMMTCDDSEFTPVLERLNTQMNNHRFMLNTGLDKIPSVLHLYLRKVNDSYEFYTSTMALKKLKLLLNHTQALSQRPHIFAHAINRNSMRVCQQLLEVDSNVNHCLNDSESALHCAVRLNSVQKVELIMKKQPDLTVQWRGLTPFEFAIATSACEEILLILSKAMSTREIEKTLMKCCTVGETPLTCCARLGVHEWIQQLTTAYCPSDNDGTGLCARDIMGKYSGPNGESDVTGVYARDIMGGSNRENAPHARNGAVMRNWYLSQKRASYKFKPGDKRSCNKDICVSTVRNCRSHFNQNITEVELVKTLTIDVLKKVSQEISQTKCCAHLAFDVELSGSMAENTKCYFPDEIDLLCVFKHTENFEFLHTSGDYFRIQVEHEAWSKLCVEGLLEQGKVSSALYTQIERALTKLIAKGIQFGKLHLFKYSLVLRDKISGLQLLFRGDTFKDMVVYVDLVPAFKLPNDITHRPAESLPLDVEYGEFYLIAKKSRHEVDVTDCEFRVTTSVGERAVINKLNKNARGGFIFAKAVRLAGICGRKSDYTFRSPYDWIREPIRTEDFLTSFLLKTILFSILMKSNDAQESKSAYEWALQIYKQLQEKLRDKAIPAWNYKTAGYLLYCKDCDTGSLDDKYLQACCKKRKLISEFTVQIILWLEENAQELKDIRFS